MADVSKLRRGRLGAPPPPPPPPTDEASPNLSAPEIAPAAPPVPEARSARESKVVAHTAARLDGRSLRRTNRVVPLALRVTPEFDEHLRAIAVRDRLLLVEVLEHALAAYDRQGTPSAK